MDIDTHPNPQPNPHHRKIDLQSPHDLTYLQENLAQSALQKLDLHFPKISQPATHISLGGHNNDTSTTNTSNSTNPPSQPTDAEEDPMRRRVHDLVSSFLHTTWSTASSNIAVNGIDASTLTIPHTATLSDAPKTTTTSSSSSTRDEAAQPQEEIEGLHYQYAAFDAALQRRLAGLHGELEALTAQVAKLRRTAPGQGAEVYEARIRAAMEDDDARFEAEVKGGDERDVQGFKVESVREGWNEDVREMYELGVGELTLLAGVGGNDRGVKALTLTETVGKAQRARNVALEME